MKRNRQLRGFTLIEVTLAIVIGIIMIAGATLIYNQAKTSAGNSRAQAKVASLQSLVEQYMARADGVAPDVDALRALWERSRPDDFNKSPWGGLAQPTLDPDGTTAANGVFDGLDHTDDRDQALSTQIIAGEVDNTGAARNTPGHAGILIYYEYPGAGNYAIWDESRRRLVKHKTYGIAMTNQQGDRWFYVRGNSSGDAEESTTDLSGVIGE